jgi:hypothetical protein
MPPPLISVCPVVIAPRCCVFSSLIWGLLAALSVNGGTARAHDLKRPAYTKDCHKTDAEMREDGSWWGRLGIPVYKNPRDSTEVPNWILGEWIKIRDEAIARDDHGKPVRNPEGEAVICHDLTVVNDGVYVSPNWTVVWCFVPPFEV